ncbi:MAG: phosphomannomutase/phosphoglucomutase, partial [Acidobacteriota bacterium]
MGVFKSYDIRGIYGKEWDGRSAYRIGFFLPRLLGAREIVVGRDARLSSEEIFARFTQGVREAGCAVADLGLCTTPTVYFATARYGLDGGVMITASHNPPEYNGLKISAAGAVPVGYGSGLERLEAMVASDEAAEAPEHTTAPRGAVRQLDARADYLAHLARFSEGIRGVRAVVDCSDGMASVLVHDVIRDLDGRFVLMYDTPDGRFPHHPPNPLVEANLADLKRRTLQEKAHLGICFDGDADRVMFVDAAGRFISPDLIIALLGLHFFKHGPEDHRGELVSYDVRTSRCVVEYIQSLGGKPAICRVGHSHAKKLLRETGGLYGGELAGHYYFRDNYFCDSGMIAALLVLSILSREGKSLEELIAGIRRYHSSGEINFRTQAKDRIIAALLQEYRAMPGARLTEIDGIRLDYPRWWFNLRKSNTEPFLRLVLEADAPEGLQGYADELKAKIFALDP